MTAFASILVLCFTAYIFRNYWLWLIKARIFGIETDASVSRIEEDVQTAAGAEYPRRYVYVTFQTRNGLKNEARLLNPAGTMIAGERLRIRYSPEKAEYAVFIRLIENDQT